MTNKQALREEFEQWWEINYHNGNPPRFGWEHWRDGDGYQIEDDESELDGMWEAWQAAHSSKLKAAGKRIAELEARDKPKFVQCWSCKHDIEVLAIADCDGYCPRCAVPIDLDDEPYTAGIRINGEG
ncbi:hypothetical protein [Leclercia pneumoniae]|uniref:hypothetical protein n=1 Tax=Leclercia pneumoniae TaxID=2815358 RepID=UPI0030CEE926